METHILKAKIREKDFQAQVISLAKLYGWKVAHFTRAQIRPGRWVTPTVADARGFPDLLLARGQRLLVAELKVGKNVPSPKQASWLEAFRLAGAQAFVWRPEDWLTIVEVLAP